MAMSEAVLEQCTCPGCDRCEPAGGPCSREAVEELNQRCVPCGAVSVRHWAETIPPGPRVDIPPTEQGRPDLEGESKVEG